MDNTFVVMWDMFGLETIIPVEVSLYNASEEEKIMRILKDADTDEPLYINKINNIISQLIMRARVNSQRHYEIYVIDTAESINEETLESCFHENPQVIVDLIREKGRKIYGSRLTDKVCIIR